ncbi:hypothetical protein BGZ60DRAFT_44612 [Tricladium varicosporioides]|nr:hypothetical protein BGZ60DRAFT_44612 [Hymenoscyphus varicosporioides]
MVVKTHFPLQHRDIQVLPIRLRKLRFAHQLSFCYWVQSGSAAIRCSFPRSWGFEIPGICKRIFLFFEKKQRYTSEGGTLIFTTTLTPNAVPFYDRLRYFFHVLLTSACSVLYPAGQITFYWTLEMRRSLSLSIISPQPQIQCPSSTPPLPPAQLHLTLFFPNVPCPMTTASL